MLTSLIQLKYFFSPTAQKSYYVSHLALLLSLLHSLWSQGSFWGKDEREGRGKVYKGVAWLVNVQSGMGAAIQMLILSLKSSLEIPQWELWLQSSDHFPYTSHTIPGFPKSIFPCLKIA